MFLLRIGFLLGLFGAPFLALADNEQLAPASVTSSTNSITPTPATIPVPNPSPASDTATPTSTGTTPPSAPPSPTSLPIVPALNVVAPPTTTAEQLPTITLAAAPTWVKPLDPDAISAPAPDHVEDGVDYLLVDRQQRMDPPTLFYHYTRRLVNEHGLQEGSEIRGEFDPSYQTFTMNWLKIKRGGVWQDRLATEKYQVLRREENLDSQMLDGRYSVVYHLEDIRVGDEIDFAYTVTGSNPVFNGKFACAFDTTWGSPVHLMSSQIITAPDRKVSFKSYASPLEPTRTTLPDQSELLTWKKNEIPASFAEGDTPGWYDTFGWVQVSEYSSWKEVVDWAMSIYPFDEPLSPELKNKVAEIAKASSNPEDQALAVINFVQDEIRYLGVELGPNSYKPTSPSIVCEHRFGDCKDKALLCVSMLRALGIEAYPALVNTGYRQKTVDLLPSPLAFDHVIVELFVNNQPYWIDATRTGQHGHLRNFYVGNYQQALVLKAGNDSLTPMTVSADSMPHEEIEDTFIVKSVTDPVLFQVHTVYSGLSADFTRANFGSSSREKIEKSYLDYYSDHYPKIKSVKPIRSQDSPGDNRFEVWEEYSIPDFWTRDSPTSKWKASFTPYSLSNAMGSVPSPQRVAPYHLNYPSDITENLEVRMWENWNISSKPNEVNTLYFTYSDHPSIDKNILHFNYHYKAHVPDVMPADITDYHDQVKKIKDTLSYILSYMPATKVTPPPPEPFRANWMTMALCGLFFGLCCYIAFRIYAIRRSGPPLPINREIAQYDGIRGWLILVLLGFILRALMFLKFILVDNIVTWDANRWNNLTVPGSPSYDPWWAPSLLMEMSFSIALFVASILSVILLLRSVRFFPKWQSFASS